MKSIAPLPNRSPIGLSGYSVNYRGSMGNICGLKMGFSLSCFIINLTWRHSLLYFRYLKKIHVGVSFIQENTFSLIFTQCNHYCFPLILNICTPQVNCVCILCQMFRRLSCFFCRRWSKTPLVVRKNMNLAKSLQLHNTDMLSSYLAFFGMMESTNVVSPTLRTFDFDSSYTQIMIYVRKLLLRNYKQWIFRLWLQDHSSDAVTVCYVSSVLLNRKWRFIRKNKMHVMMKNPLGESH